MDNQGRFEAVDLGSVLYSSYEVESIPDAAKAFIERGQGGQLDELDIAKSQRLQRTFTITDVDYYRGEIFVAGLSNEEFSSTLRRVPFPFQGTSSVTNIESLCLAGHRQVIVRLSLWRCRGRSAAAGGVRRA